MVEMPTDLDSILADTEVRPGTEMPSVFVDFFDDLVIVASAFTGKGTLHHELPIDNQREQHAADAYE